MKRLLLLIVGLLTLSGCYTIVYPPPYDPGITEAGGDSLLIPDSGRSGVTIYNQNQVILDNYYQDPYYYRPGFWGGYHYWDPYYYNPYGYHHPRRWWRHHYYRGSHPSQPEAPAPMTPRREKDIRRSDTPPLTPSPPLKPAPDSTPPQAASPEKEVQKPDSAKADPPKVEEKERSLRSTEPAATETEKQAPPTESEEKKPRREKGREK